MRGTWIQRRRAKPSRRASRCSAYASWLSLFLPHAPPSPARPQNKTIRLLHYPFRDFSFQLAQLDNGITNGSALWLGAQCLTLYLQDLYRNKSFSSRRPRAIELGSGIGLSALALSCMGWDVIATDLPNVISSVLAGNIAQNLSQLPVNSGQIEVRALDWTVPPDQWVWHDRDTIASPDPLMRTSGYEGDGQHGSGILGPPFDLIISSDTLYSPDIIQPLFRTLHALSSLSVPATSTRPPPIYLCVERRDPALIDRALSEAKETFHFHLERIPHKKLAKALEKGGANWDREDWEGIEVWKCTVDPTSR